MKSRQPDYILLIIIGILVVFGLIMVSSASVDLSQEIINKAIITLKIRLRTDCCPAC